METENPTLPGNPELPSSQEELQSLAALDTGTYRYSVEDYFRKPALSAFKLSPGGTWIAYRERDARGRRPIFVRHFETGEVRKVLDEGEELIDGYLWVTDDRLLYVQDKSGDENHQLYGINVDGTGFQALTPFDGVKVMLLNQLKEDPEHIIIQMNKENPQLFEPYKINVNTGALEKLYTNDNPMSPVMGYQFDKDGRLRALTRQENGVEYVLLYRKDEASPFEEIVRTGWQDSFGLLGFDYTSDNPHLAYVSSNLESDTEEIIRYDLATRTQTETLFRHETYDAGGLTTSRMRGFEIDFYYYTGEKDIIIPVSETFTRLHSIFSAFFQGMEFSVAGRTDDESRYLLYAGSDRNYGAYYLYDTTSDSFEKIAEMMPHLNPADMAEMRPVQFHSRDGLKLHGYLTLPAEASEGKVPLIVNPHGGPYGPRDEWGFNPEAQLFASRGYATLQINYRGSGGYGKKFYLAGSKQIGRRMLDDLEDGVAFALENFSIDPERVAIYGGSYGGLAALGSLVKTPELYCCAVDYVGVSNLFTFYESFPPYWKPFMGQLRAQWYDFEDEADQEIMKQVSPALNTEKITRPVYVVQGANDPRVNINESDQMVANLRARGFHVPYMVKYNEGHGFQHEENRIELYKTMLGFFARHLRG